MIDSSCSISFYVVLPFMVALSFRGNFRVREKNCKNTCYKFFAIISFALLQSSCFNFYVHFKSICLLPFTQMPSLNRHEEVTCEDCGTQITKLNLARHKKRCYQETNQLCYLEFRGFYASRQHRNSQHGMQIASGTRDVDVEHIVGNVEDQRLREEELRSCQHFLVDSELERARYKQSIQLRSGNSQRNNRDKET